jgi:hypothetical protein
MGYAGTKRSIPSVPMRALALGARTPAAHCRHAPPPGEDLRITGSSTQLRPPELQARLAGTISGASIVVSALPNPSPEVLQRASPACALG